MSTSYYVTFHRKPTDPEWEKKFAAVVALCEAGVTELPEPLAKYFGTKYADPEIVKAALQVADVNLNYPDKQSVKGVTREDNNYGATVVIDLDDLPKDIRVLRVSVSC